MIEFVIGSHVAELMDVIKREEAKRVAIVAGGTFREPVARFGTKVKRVERKRCHAMGEPRGFAALRAGGA